MKRLLTDEKGGAVVEATFLFPIMIMIFFCLMLLAMYLPQKAILQHAVQTAVTAVTVEKSDDWLAVTNNNGELKYQPPNFVYAELFETIDSTNAESIVKNLSKKGIFNIKTASLVVDVKVTNKVIYKEVQITATQTITMPIDFSFVGFQKELVISETASGVVVNGDEFIRNIDMAVDLAQWVDKKFDGKVTKVFEKLGGMVQKVRDWGL